MTTAQLGQSIADVVRDGHARGWSFTPLRGKVPTETGWQKLPRETAAQAAAWAAAGNVGLRCGAASGHVYVVDADIAKGASVEGLELPPTVTVRTGGHGLHFYYRGVEGDTLGNSAGKLGPHIDVRGNGGQVVAAGSVHPDTGSVYEYEEGRAPWEIELAPLPQSIRAALAPKPATRTPTVNGAHPPAPMGDHGSDRYALGALKAECKNVAGAPEGQRNIALNKAAFVLGQFVGAGRLERRDVEVELLASTPLPEGEASKTIRSGIEAGARAPREREAPRVRRTVTRPPPGSTPTVGTPGTPPAQPPPETAFGPPRPIVAAPAPPGAPPPSAFPTPPVGESVTPEQAEAHKLLTDLGNAERLVRRHGENWRFVVGPSRWHAWDGKRWAPDLSGQIMGACKETVLSVFAEASRASGETMQKALSAWAIKSQSRDRISAMDAMARHRLSVNATEMDLNPWHLNSQNGTVDLRTGEVLPHRREHLISRIVPVAFDPTAECPRWERFLEEILPDAGVRTYVHRWLGYSCTGDIREQYLPIFWGEGNNGKNVLLDTVSAVLGDYAAEAPPDLLTAGGGGGDHPTDIADVLGRRLVIASETEAYAKLRVQLMKRLTGNAKLKGRYMRQDFFEFVRTHKMVLATNNKPQITETTEAVWRRIRLVNFGVIIPDNRIDKSLMIKLVPEYPGILAWLVRGAVDWLREGLTEPAGVRDATQAYRNKSDVFADFAAEHIRLDPQGFAASDELQKTYASFCKAIGAEPCAPGELRDKVARLGAVPGKTPAKRGWVGIKLL